MKKISRNNYGVSEVVGTIFILGISISLFSYVYFTLFSIDSPPDTPMVDIVGRTPDEDNIVFSHMGGDSISLDSLVIVTVGGKEIIQTVGDLLDEEAKKDGVWNIGEELVINYDLRGLLVEARIVDKVSNSVVMMGVLQEGDMMRDPYCFTVNATDIQADSAKLSMGYNFWLDSGSVRFAYRKSGGSWEYTTWVAKSGESSYEEMVNGLEENEIYEYKAQLEWGVNLTEGGVKLFTTALPTIETLDATDIKTTEAKLWLKYDFWGLSGAISFSYKLASGSTWTDTPWVNVSGQGTYSELIIGLTEETSYEFKARLKYDANIIEGAQKSFMTWSIIMGRWTFSEGANTTAYDTSGHDNHGTIYGAEWTVGINTTGLSFDGIDDIIQVFDAASLDVTEDITLEAWVKSQDNSNGTIGDISSSLKDTSWFGSDYGYDSDLIQIKDKYFAIAFRGDGNDGFIATAIIDSSGTINNIIDYYEFETSYCVEPDIIHISGDIYAIVYEGPGNDGFIKTVDIDVLGQITDSVIDKLEYDILYGQHPNIIHINGDVYAIAYVGFAGDGYAKTVEIQNDGNIISVLDITIFCDTESGTRIAEPKIVHIANDNYAIVYRNPDDDGEVRVIKIDSDGDFNSPSKFDGRYGDKFTFDQYDSWRPTGLKQISGDVYACVYRGRDGKGTLLTLRIAADGDIDDNIIDKYYFDPLICYEPELVHVVNNYYAIPYRGVDDDGFLSIVEIAADGTITPSVISSYEFDPYDCYKPTISYYTGDIFIISYTRYNEGLLQTVKIPSSGNISVTSPIIHSSRYTLFDFIEPDIVQVNGDIYAIACRGLDSDGYVRTVQISSGGSINDNVISFLEFDTIDCYDPKIIHVTGKYYAIAYRGPNYHGFVKTIQIENDGEIVGIIDTLEFDSSAGYEPDIINVATKIFAIAYRGPNDDGFVITVEINSMGDIEDMVLDSLEFETSYCFEPDMIHVSGDIYAIAYRGPGDDGYVTTVRIINDGDILNTYVDYYEYNPWCGWTPDIINIYDKVYAIVFTYQNWGGYMSTIEIADNGLITKTVIDSFRFDNKQPSGDYHCYDPQIIHIDEWVYAIAYRGQYDGYVKTLRIGNLGDISDVNDDYLMFDGYGYEPQIIHIDGNIYAMPFRRNSYNARLITIEIITTPTVRIVLYKQNAYGLFADSTTVYGLLNSKWISAPLEAGFNYVTLTYNRSLASNQLKLYVNGALKTEDTYSSLISSTNYHLYMGEYNCILDEVTIWDVALDAATILITYNLLKA